MSHPARDEGSRPARAGEAASFSCAPTGSLQAGPGSSRSAPAARPRQLQSIAGRASLRLLCVDFGTSSIKAGVVGGDGQLLGWAHESLLDDPRADLVRWEPGLWISHLKAAIEKLQAAGAVGPGDGGDLAAVIVSGNGPTIVPVGATGEALSEAFLWIDRRELRPIHGTSFYLPKVEWIRRHRPDLYERTASFLPFPEYLNFLLTGEKVAIVPSEEFVPYVWSEQEIAASRFDRGKFPPFVRIGERIGKVTARGAAASGLPKGLPVVAGGSDFLMALVGTAAVVPGRTCDRAGTSEGINHCSARLVRSDRVRCLPHAIPGLYNAAGILASTGRIFEWFRAISGQREKPYQTMLEEILAVDHNARIPFFFPSLRIGETWEFSDAVFSQLEPEHGPAEMGRAVVQSIGFAVRDLIETLEHHSCRIEQLRACGGQARNPLWNQMKADITGKEIATPEIIDAELLGDACAGLVGLGDRSSLAEAAEGLVRIKTIYLPRREEHERFGEAYERYRDLRRRVLRAVASVVDAQTAGGLVE